MVLYTREGCSPCLAARAAILAVRREVEFAFSEVDIGWEGELYEDHKHDIPVVTISVDDGWAPVDKFLAQPKTPFRVALDEGAKTSRVYGTSKFPESYLVDRDGNGTDEAGVRPEERLGFDHRDAPPDRAKGMRRVAQGRKSPAKTAAPAEAASCAKRKVWSCAAPAFRARRSKAARS